MTPQELKNSILQLAIQGKLVEQRPEEGTAEELYQRIQEEKKRLVKEGKIKKEKPLPEITEEEVPFDIPESWGLVRFGSVVSLLSGTDFKPEEYNDQGKGTVYITGASNLSEDGVIISRWTETPRNIAEHGDVLLVCKGSGYGKTVICDVSEAHIARQIMAVKKTNSMSMAYIRYFLQANIQFIKSKGQGVIPGIDRTTVLGMIFPLPPLAEQKRIVAKIEELLPYIDRYEQAWSKLEAFNKRFPTDMQKSILQTAIQGKLVEQRPEEGSGEDLYQQIQAEKQRLVKEGKIKKEKPLPEIAEDEVPFDIPESWKWVIFGDISEFLGTGLVRSNSEQYIHADYFYFKMNNIENFTGKCTFDGMKMVYAKDEEFEKHKLRPLDFLFNTRNSRELVGKTAVVPADVSSNIILNNNILKIAFYCSIDPFYMNYYFISPLGRKQLQAFITNTTNVAAIYQKQLSTLMVPLPPLAEQKRIVAKLEELLPLCERLK